MRKFFVAAFLLLAAIASFLLAQVRQEWAASGRQTAGKQPEILMSTNSLGNGWQVYALNPDTGDLRRVTNPPADN